MGGSSDNFHIKRLFVNQHFITLFLCFYFNSFFSPFPILFSHTPNWLRQYATNWKVAGSIPDEVIFFFKFT
jgi:hypothetical protein